jgi:hypothetical protein
METIIALFGIVFTIVGAILLILAPFFIYGINSRTKETALGVKQTNKLLTEILAEARKESA